MCHLSNLNIIIKPESVLASHSANSYWRMNFDNIIKYFFEELPVNMGSSDTQCIEHQSFIRTCLEGNRIVTLKVSSFNNFQLAFNYCHLPTRINEVVITNS